MDTVDTLLLGRVTYEMFAGYWPNVTEGAEAEGYFADKFTSLSKVIFSKSLERAPWGKWKEGRIVKRAAVEEVASLKQQPGRDMLISGSISLAQALMEADAIDEYRLVLASSVEVVGQLCRCRRHVASWSHPDSKKCCTRPDMSRSPMHWVTPLSPPRGDSVASGDILRIPQVRRVIGSLRANRRRQRRSDIGYTSVEDTHLPR